MSTRHEGTIQTIHLFNEAWSFVKKEEGINLKTEREKARAPMKPFHINREELAENGL